MTKIKPQTTGWRIKFNNKKHHPSAITGVNNNVISRHLINLRPSKIIKLTTNTTEPVLLATSAASDRIDRWSIKSVNFLNPDNQLWYVPWIKLEKKFPLLKGLTILFLLEAVAWLLYHILRFFVIWFWRLNLQVTRIIKSILEDVVYFFELITRFFKYCLTPRSIFKQQDLSHTRFMVPQLGQILIFIIVLLFILSPLKILSLYGSQTNINGYLAYYANAALRTFNSASENLLSGQYLEAHDNFITTSKYINQAVGILNKTTTELGMLLNSPLILGNKMEAAEKVLAAAKELSEVGIIFSHTFDILYNTPAKQLNDIELANKTLLLKQALIDAQPKIGNSYQLLNEIKTKELPDDLAQQMTNLKLLLIDLQKFIYDFSAVPELLSTLVPSTGQKTYLLVFQNYSELRPTGGFMGSLAFVYLQDGKITNIQIPGGGPYDLQGQLPFKLKPPTPLTVVNNLWQLQDSNWYFDFPTSAKNIAWFVEQSWHIKLDGVISLNPDVVIELLKITGPIELVKYHKTLTAENFIRETQEAVDLEYDKTQNRPKEFIADLTPLLLDRLLQTDSKNILAIYATLNNMLKKKSIQLYVNDTNAQKLLVNLGWDGGVAQYAGDYLAIVRTNIGGGKTDLVIDEKVDHQTTISPQGQLITTVKFTRHHGGDPFDIFYQRKNNSWLKFYVPLGSTLLTAKGFDNLPANYFKSIPEDAREHNNFSTDKVIGQDTESKTIIGQEYGKTYFANWLVLVPGETKTVTLTYQLPFSLSKLSDNNKFYKYQVFFQRQSGTKPLLFNSVLNKPTNLIVKWSEASPNLQTIGQPLHWQGDWKTDSYYGLLFESSNK